MAMENMSGMMAVCMKVSGLKIKSTAKVSMSGQMAESTTVSGEIITCTAVASTPGKMAECTKATTKTIANMVMESTLGTMGNSMKAGGKMASNTEKVSIEKTVVIEEESGKTAKELNGWMTSSGKISKTLVAKILMLLIMKVIIVRYNEKC